MQIPKREKRTREDIIAYMRECAKQYVPEWRYDAKHPDAGTALVSLFADMTEDTMKRFNLSAAGDMAAFFQELHAKLLPARPAEGFVTFGLPEGFAGAEEVPQGTKLLAQTQEEPVLFETQEDVLVRQMDLEKIYLSNPWEDGIYQVFDKDTEEKPSFFLFQNKGRNLQRHRILFCFSRGLEIRTRARAEFSVRLSGPGPEAEEWQRAVEEGTGIRFSYGTAGGFRPLIPEGPIEQKPDSDYRTLSFWIEGGEEGIAPLEEFGSLYVIQAEIQDVELCSKFWFSSVSLSVQSKGQRPDLIHVNGIDQEPEDFLVFGPTPSLYDECYLVNEEVLGKAGARIRLEFDLDFVKLPLEQPAEEKTKWKTIMKKREFVPEKEYDITVQEVLWEYYNGYGWARLPEGSAYRHLFLPKEEFRGQRVKLEFTCPKDISRVLVNAAETYAVRVRILKMNNAYKTRGAYVAPVAGRVSFGYDYSAAPLKPVQILRQNNLARQVISKEEMEQNGFAVSLCDRNPDERTACYLGFAQPASGGPLKILFVLPKTMDQSIPAVRWEYLGSQGWKPLHPIDGTKGFGHTGLVSFFLAGGLCRAQLFEQELYWIRLLEPAGPGRGRKEGYPKIEGIYPNSTRILGIETVEERFGLSPYAEEKQISLPDRDIVKIQVRVLERQENRQGMISTVWETWQEAEELGRDSGKRREFAVDRQQGLVTFPKYMENMCLNEQGEIQVRIRYEHCQGERGNRKAGEINRLSRSIGFISSSYNPIASAGGTKKETVPEALLRNAQILRHGYRCVSARDYEDMAREAVQNISKVKCFSGYDKTGKPRPGAVTLVVLPKDYEENFDSFEKIRLQMEEYFSTRMDETTFRQGRFSIVRPALIRLDVKASVELLREKEVFSVQKRIHQELERFLHPLKGNFYGEGWEIGSLPNPNQIVHALKRTEGAGHVKNLTLRRFCEGGFAETEQKEEELPFYRLPRSGTHEIELEL